jgi:hypothetical protein
MKPSLAFILTVCILSQVACGSNLIASFKAGFAATKPFIQTLVSQGVISQAKADAAIADVDSSLDFASVAQTCLSAAASDRGAKAQCYLTLANNLRTILARHNIGGSPQLDRIATIAESAILAFQAYFNRVNSRAVGRNAVDADKQLEADLKAVRADLKALTGK